MPQLSCIILTFNTNELTQRAVRALLDSAAGIDLEVLVVDNASEEPFVWQGSSQVRLVRNEENVGFAAGVNQAISLTSAELVLLLNSDVIMNPAALRGLLSAAAEGAADIIAPAMRFPDGSFQPSAGRFPTLGSELIRFLKLGRHLSSGTLLYVRPASAGRSAADNRPVDWVSGGCVLIRRSVFEKIGQLDPAFFLGFDDFDFCFRARQAGLAVLYLPALSVIHYHAVSSGGHRSLSGLRREREGALLFWRKHMPRRRLSRWLVGGLYSLKIFLLGWRRPAT